MIPLRHTNFEAKHAIITKNALVTDKAESAFSKESKETILISEETLNTTSLNDIIRSVKSNRKTNSSAPSSFINNI